MVSIYVYIYAYNKTYFFALLFSVAGGEAGTVEWPDRRVGAMCKSCSTKWAMVDDEQRSMQMVSL